eukprot:3855087-Pleurochrysis_carterae.AAC.2
MGHRDVLDRETIKHHDDYDRLVRFGACIGSHHAMMAVRYKHLGHNLEHLARGYGAVLVHLHAKLCLCLPEALAPPDARWYGLRNTNEKGAKLIQDRVKVAITLLIVAQSELLAQEVHLPRGEAAVNH